MNVFAGAARAVLAAHPVGRPAAAAFEMVERATRRYPKPSWDLDTTTLAAEGTEVRVHRQIALVTPFCELLRFAREVDPSRPADPKVLVVAPISGHHATLLRETVRELLPAHDVYITDWIDARLVPADRGPFGLHDYIDLVIQMLQKLGPDAHILAVCQPCPAVLAAVARMAEDGDRSTPRTMTLMSGPVDSRINPTKVGEFAEKHSLAKFERTVIHRVPPGEPGHGRPVYPGVLQLNAFLSMDPLRHMEAHLKHAKHVAFGDDDAAQKHRRFYDEYFAVMDMPAEFYLETVGEIFQEQTLARGTMIHHGRKIRPEAIDHTALLTVEGGKDEITAPGQTYAAHALCRGLPANEKRQHLQADVGHYGTFSGTAWRQEIAPVIGAFIREHSAPSP